MTQLEHEINRPTALQRSRAAAKALSVTARKLRFSTSNRSQLYKAVGLRAPLADRLLKYAFIFNTIFLLIVPILGSSIYFGLIASEQYRSEARFVVRTSTPALGKDQLGRVTGLPSAKILQDTLIVSNYIYSRAILEVLEQEINLRSHFTSDKIDFFSRLAQDASYEDLLDYWKSKVKTSVSPSSGIITVTVDAFSAEDARAILAAVVKASEQAINQLSDRIWNDVISTAKVNLDRATQKLSDVRERVATEQNRSGVLTVEGSSAILSTLLTSLLKEKIDLQQTYAVNLKSVSKDAPQMRILAREIASKQDQIEDIQRRIASERADSRNLADVSAQLTSLEFERQLAEQQFSASVRTFEQVQFLSKQQLMYLDSFLKPSLPDDALYPRRIFWIGITALVAAFTCAASIGGLFVIRNKFS